MAKKTKTQPKARKTITSNNLADLSKLVQALEIDDENPENQQKPSAFDKKIIYNEFQNSTYTLVSPMAYLIGIDKENFGEENARPFLLKSYEELDAHKEARIIRNLSGGISQSNIYKVIVIIFSYFISKFHFCLF